MTAAYPTADPNVYIAEHPIVIAPAWVDPKTGAVYVHKDLEPRLGAWEVEEHIGPTDLDESLGDVPSFATYLNRYGQKNTTFVSWNRTAITAVLDYVDSSATSLNENRHKWTARMPFVLSTQLHDWQRLCTGSPVSQGDLVERLEDLADDIVDPQSADVVALLRDLRAHVRATATSKLNADGSSDVAWQQERSTDGTTIPPLLRIAVPILRGDLQRYQLIVRLRVTIKDGGGVTFRLALANLDRVIDAALLERVTEAAGLLANGVDIVRAAD